MVPKTIDLTRLAHREKGLSPGASNPMIRIKELVFDHGVIFDRNEDSSNDSDCEIEHCESPQNKLAEAVGFEPTVDFHPLQFSRLLP